MKMNFQTGLTTINATAPTLDIRETGVEINGLGEIANIGLQAHAAYEVAFSEPPATVNSTLTLTIPGTSGSSAYKPEIEVIRTLSSQYSATGEDHYVVRTAANTFGIVRAGRNGNNLVGTVRVFIRFSANTDALQPNT
jgi:hypothetical protein